MNSKFKQLRKPAHEPETTRTSILVAQVDGGAIIRPTTDNAHDDSDGDWR